MIDPFVLRAVVEAAWKAAKTEEEWMLDTTIYPLGEFLINKDTFKMKVADGEHQYKDLPFVAETKEFIKSLFADKEQYYPLSTLYSLAYEDDVNGDCNGMIDITAVATLSSADVAPVVHGEWVITDRTEYGVEAKCSECGYEMIFGRCRIGKYCPDCGARMDGGNKND